MSRPFERFAGTCAILVGLVGLLYSVAFVADRQDAVKWADDASEVLLMVGGLLTTAVFVAVYGRLRETDAGFALLALVLGLAGAIGSAVHGAFNLARSINPPNKDTDVPNPIDPRGFLTFAVAGLALFFVAWLVVRGGRFPLGLGYLAFISAFALIVVYLGRLIALETENQVVLFAAVLTGFFLNPTLYLWLGVVLIRGPRESRSAKAADTERT